MTQVIKVGNDANWNNEMLNIRKRDDVMRVLPPQKQTDIVLAEGDTVVLTSMHTHELHPKYIERGELEHVPFSTLQSANESVEGDPQFINAG